MYSSANLISVFLVGQLLNLRDKGKGTKHLPGQ